MFNHLLTFLALISFSIVSYAAAIPMDADQAVRDATQNAVLHQDVAAIQGGRFDKDVAETYVSPATCPADAICVITKVAHGEVKSQSVSDWFVVQESTSALQPVAVLLLIIGLIVFFLSRKSSSTK